MATPAETARTPLLLSVIVPARNEEDVLPGCLRSLLVQSEEGFALGEQWELLLVDDGSTDRTHTIMQEAASTDGVKLIAAPYLAHGLTGKTNACWAGAQRAAGAFLLFTDADTVHEPGALSRARHELEKYEVALLSYSPRQLTSGLAQRLLMPLVFAELAMAYPMKRVNLPGDRMAAANGQFLMVERAAYFATGGHQAVGAQILEDVALAQNIKRASHALRFRYAPDAVSARMYRSTAAMIEGWTKNLALLFGSPLLLAAMRSLDLLLAFALPLVALLYPFFTTLQRTLLWVVWARVLWRFYARVAKSNFSFRDCALSLFGLPLFVFLLVRSYIHVRRQGVVEWKGRRYPTAIH